MTTVYPGFISDAGMFAEAGVKLPPGVGTRTPEAVADAVVRGIEEGKAELDVAPLAMRVGARLLGPLAHGDGRPAAADWGRSRLADADAPPAQRSKRR